ncbi:hypothetical protein ACWGIU_33030 [Streptomyces sp. NPDC054840]
MRCQQTPKSGRSRTVAFAALAAAIAAVVGGALGTDATLRAICVALAVILVTVSAVSFKAAKE